MSLSLTEINEALKPYRQEARQQLELEKQLAALRHQLASHKENLKYLDDALAKEWADVEALTKSRWRNFWQSLKLEGTKDILLEKEQKEWEIVRDERQNLLFLTSEIETEIKVLESKRKYLGEVSAPLIELLGTKHQILLASETHDIYQGIVVEEKELKQQIIAIEKLNQGFQLVISNLQKVEVLIQDQRLIRKNPEQLIHFINTTYLVLNKLTLESNKQKLDLALPFPMQDLISFEAQLNLAVNSDEWYGILKDFENKCAHILTQLQTQETTLMAQADVLHDRRQKFLLESY